MRGGKCYKKKQKKKQLKTDGNVLPSYGEKNSSRNEQKSVMLGGIGRCTKFNELRVYVCVSGALCLRACVSHTISVSASVQDFGARVQQFPRTEKPLWTYSVEVLEDSGTFEERRR